MKRVRYKLIYNRKNKLNSDGKAVIQLRITFDRVSQFFSTEIYLKPDEWNENKKEVTNKCKQSNEYNLYLKLFLKKCEDFENDLIKKSIEFSFQLLDETFSNKKETSNFISFMWKEFENQILSVGAKRHHKKNISAVERFNSNLKFSYLNFSFIQNFDIFIRKRDTVTSENTVSSYHKVLKKYITIALNKGLIDRNPFSLFKLKSSPTRKTSLDKDELEKIENLSVTDRVKMYASNFEEIKDMFLFSCYSGLRFSDIQKLTHENFYTNKNGLMLDLEKQQKTGKEKVIPLSIIFNGKPEKIIKPYLHREELVFVKLTNQHINRTLKTISMLCNINKNLTFHVSRHTFGTLLAEITGDLYMIQDLMSHSNIQTSMNYIHLNQERKNDSLRKVDWDK